MTGPLDSLDEDGDAGRPVEHVPSGTEPRLIAQQWRERATADEAYAGEIRRTLARMDEAVAAGAECSHLARLVSACVLQCLQLHADVAAAALEADAGSSDDACTAFMAACNRLQVAVWACSAAATELHCVLRAVPRGVYEQPERLAALAAERASKLMWHPINRSQLSPGAHAVSSASAHASN